MVARSQTHKDSLRSLAADPESPIESAHPFPTGYVFESPGAHLTYRVVGPCCRLYDRDQLPWPCCRIQWRGKEPSWRRIGRRFIADLSTRKHPSYCVEIVGQSYRSEPIIMTLYTEKLSAQQQNWWHTKRLVRASIHQSTEKQPSSQKHLVNQSPHSGSRLAAKVAAQSLNAMLTSPND